MGIFNMYKDYIANKAISLLITASIYYLSGLFTAAGMQWTLLVMVYVFFGNGHHFTSAIYQIKSLNRKLPSIKGKMAYAFLVLASFLLFAYLNFAWTFAFGLTFIAVYFFIHHIFNERTMFVSCSKKEKNSYIVTFYVLFLFFWIFFPTINSTSFQFTLDRAASVITFSGMAGGADLAAPSYAIAGILSASFMALALALLLVYAFMNYNNIRMILFLTSLLVVFLAIGYLRLFSEFIGLVGFLIIYHYITWFIYFLTKTTKSGYYLRSRKGYLTVSIVMHLVLLILLVFGNMSGGFADTMFFYALFSLQFFVIWSFLHISSTLINEKPINRFLKF
ncbi:hypothetical protein HYU09_01230 [Candidatus Woesearchaeota archaeon]|nr:hypothetical protein [Candidatus Woesearchaeota archaeon]